MGQRESTEVSLTVKARFEPFRSFDVPLEKGHAAIAETRCQREMIEVMGTTTSTDGSRSSAAKVMDEAIDLAVEGRPPYPERAAFIDADTPQAGHEIQRAADEGRSAVLVAADGTSRVFTPEPTAHHRHFKSHPSIR